MCVIYIERERLGTHFFRIQLIKLPLFFFSIRVGQDDFNYDSDLTGMGSAINE